MILQNAALQQSQTLLLKYASTLAREKNVLVQRTLELTERWNQVQDYLSPLINSHPVLSANVCLVVQHTKMSVCKHAHMILDITYFVLTIMQCCLPC